MKLYSPMTDRWLHTVAFCYYNSLSCNMKEEGIIMSVKRFWCKHTLKNNVKHALSEDVVGTYALTN